MPMLSMYYSRQNPMKCSMFYHVRFDVLYYICQKVGKSCFE